MISLIPQIRILVYCKPVDFRKGIDGLCAICKSRMKEDPFSGRMYVFCNKRRTDIKVLVYDGSGFWLCQKRFSKGKIRGWPSEKSSLEETFQMNSLEFQNILFGLDMKNFGYEPWKKVHQN